MIVTQLDSNLNSWRLKKSPNICMFHKLAKFLHINVRNCPEMDVKE